MDIKERMMQYLDSKGISPTKAECVLKWGKGALIKAKSVSADRVGEFLLRFPDLSAEWLLRGEGEMLKDGTTAIPESSLNEELIILRTENALLREMVGLKRKDDHSQDTKIA